MRGSRASANGRGRTGAGRQSISGRQSIAGRQSISGISKRPASTEVRMLVASKQCFELETAKAKLMPGNHTLSLKVTSAGEQYVLLSHLVWF